MQRRRTWEPPPWGRVFVGTSGWAYPAWRGAFYPPGLPRHEELAYLSTKLPSVEVNCTFYGSQRPTTFARWFEQTPRGFVFAIKGPRLITHQRQPSSLHSSLARFFSQGLLLLEDKLGPILWQFPPHAECSPRQLGLFLAQLPRTHAEAHALVDVTGPTHAAHLALRYAIEVRNPSFPCAEARRVCEAARVALVVSDAAAPWPRFSSVTTDFVYARLHGREALYTSRYEDHELDRWAQRILRWRQGESDAGGDHPLDMYLYFNNDAHGHAPYDALRLQQRVAALYSGRVRPS